MAPQNFPPKNGGDPKEAKVEATPQRALEASLKALRDTGVLSPGGLVGYGIYQMPAEATL